mgnify:FL=1
MLYAGFALVLLPRAHGQAYRVDARLDTNQIQIGDQIHLHLSLTQPRDARVEIPRWKDQLGTRLEVIKTFPPDTTGDRDDQTITITRKLLITSFDTGKVDIPPVPFHYQGLQGADSVLTPPLDLYVQTVQVDTTRDIFGIKAPFGAPLSWAEIWPWAAGLVALGLLVWALVYLLRRRKRKDMRLEPRKASEPAHVYALRELDRLKEDRLWQNDQVKAYYTRLSEILRTYLWMRYGIQTLERTTDEIMTSLKDTELAQQEAYEMLSENLRFADLVKFARLQPSPTENEGALQQAYDFVHATKYVREKEPAAEERGDEQGDAGKEQETDEQETDEQNTNKQNNNEQDTKEGS